MPISADNDQPPHGNEVGGDRRTGRVYLDTSKLPEHDRLPAFCNEIRRYIFDCDVQPLAQVPFFGTLDVRSAGAVGVAHIATTPVDFVRSATHLGPENGRVVVQLLERGTARVSQEGHEVSARSGEGIILDCRKASRLLITEVTSAWFLVLSRQEIARPEHRIGRLAATKLADGPSLRLLSGYLDSMWKEDLADHQAAQTVGGHLVDLIALALSEAGASGSGKQGGLRAARLVEVLQLISDQIGNPGLSIGVVAEQMGVTPRYIHLLLEQSDKTFARHVLQRRLERAFELLNADTRGDRKIADIAFAAGFSDLSYFNRAFRRQFGDTPSRIRANSARRTWKESDI
jgi:AraC-like DNA-binding protein